MFATVQTNVSFFPERAHTAVHPFSGFVININVMTDAHRDFGDQDGCMVLVIGDHEGGDLCFLEPKLTLETSHGDVVCFESQNYTHFNLHYTGTRASVVVHSDRYGNAYQQDLNGWDQNKHVL
jgi:hypothetical protein